MSVKEHLAALEHMSTGELVERYAELFGQPVRTRHRAYLVRKVGWRLQAMAEGDLSQRARQRAEELARDADVRLMPPRKRASADPTAVCRTVPIARDGRLPAVGAAITRQYKGRTVRVLVTTVGLEYEGRLYKSLTAIAKQVTGTHINGFRFFKLGETA